MRTIDDMIDDQKAKDETFGCLEKQILTEKVKNWINCLNHSVNGDPFLNKLIDTITTYKIPLRLFHNFARSMQYDIDNNGFATFEDFLDYADGASVAPASVFVHLCCLTKKNGEIQVPPFDVIEAARPCAIFSYIVHIIRDFQKDQKNNLNYFALDILSRYNLRPEDLKAIAHGAPVTDSFRSVIRDYMDYAQLWGARTLLEIGKLENTVKGRYLLSLHIIYNLYLQVFNRIDVDHGSFTTRELNPTMEEIRQNVMNVLEMSNISTA